MSSLSAAQVGTALGLDDTYAPWLQQLEQAGPPPQPLAAPDLAEMGALLEQLHCSAETVEETLATWPDPERDPARWWLLERAHHVLVAAMGDLDAKGGMWPQLPDALGVAGRALYLHIYATTTPVTRTWHQKLGIPDEVSWATLRDVARHEAIHRRIHGYAGIDAPSWMTLHLRSVIFELGRLQFVPFHLGVGPEPDSWYDEEEAERQGPGFRNGDMILGVHIPAGGSLEFAECEASYAAAQPFFDRFFPVPGRRLATCSSWLLDDQLAEYLPATSNIVKFQRAFHLMPGWRDGDGNVLTFVFRNRGNDPDHPVVKTSLERAVVAHLEAGRHWRWRSGWRDLVPAS
jgi:GNAT-like C-terminal domain/N-acyltransferase N-terminal domain